MSGAVSGGIPYAVERAWKAPDGARTRHALTEMRIGGLRLAILFGLAGFAYTPLYSCVGKMGLKDENRNLACRMHVPSKMVTDEYRFSRFIFGLTKYHYVDCSTQESKTPQSPLHAGTKFGTINRCGCVSLEFHHAKLRYAITRLLPSHFHHFLFAQWTKDRDSRRGTEGTNDRQQS
ncbi:hypothetical protein EV359DRAFT_66267 [Lentinula novae-zelandiae]|nr:hypothetical protein EV359DRAFT_66267 [Lentinula novae-zelandiae]